MTPEIVSVIGTLFSGICMIIVAKINADSNKQKTIDEEREKR